ncbi:hypothetical protein [Arthrospira platensis]|nr:hypothetical protein [Arthrospira platensis]MBD2672090.1 hypothetical protein [Arthrospira platensis FACHB-439]MBD2713174.1 hypothetical protein [Arthrospira platensis FACHB-835]MDF2209472.1 hypothetical protein [Arthrospira platensis NCB002]QQW31107.1 hypothetical protein AP9108_11215 [Arthrospira sp. PCC 9108]BAI90201.1 hypothetical protein NIES39_D07840 [Arthrospira platensis NIES-39]
MVRQPSIIPGDLYTLVLTHPTVGVSRCGNLYTRNGASAEHYSWGFIYPGSDAPYQAIAPDRLVGY